MRADVRSLNQMTFWQLTLDGFWSGTKRFYEPFIAGITWLRRCVQTLGGENPELKRVNESTRLLYQRFDEVKAAIAEINEILQSQQPTKDRRETIRLVHLGEDIPAIPANDPTINKRTQAYTTSSIGTSIAREIVEELKRQGLVIEVSDSRAQSEPHIFGRHSPLQIFGRNKDPFLTAHWKKYARRNVWGVLPKNQLVEFDNSIEPHDFPNLVDLFARDKGESSSGIIGLAPQKGFFDPVLYGIIQKKLEEKK